MFAGLYNHSPLLINYIQITWKFELKAKYMKAAVGNTLLSSRTLLCRLFTEHTTLIFS